MRLTDIVVAKLIARKLYREVTTSGVTDGDFIERQEATPRHEKYQTCDDDEPLGQSSFGRAVAEAHCSIYRGLGGNPPYSTDLGA